MPLLNPQINRILREAGLADSSEQSLNDKLNEHGLSLDNDLEGLQSLAVNGETDQIKLRAIETSLKLKGALKEAAAPPPSITIIIQDPQAPAGVNPILLPRELTNVKPN